MASKRRTIVAGASQGVGAAVARAFLDRGYGVVGNARKFSGESFPPSPNLALVEGGIGLATTSGEDCADRNRKVWLDRPRCQHCRQPLEQTIRGLHRSLATGQSSVPSANTSNIVERSAPDSDQSYSIWTNLCS